MSKLKKLLERIRNNPKNVRFEELDKILIHYGFTKRQSSGGSSHFYYTKGEKLLSVPFHKPHIKVTYVERAIELLEGEISDDE
ncbi:toxin HicA [Desulfosporosinus fructosivorans]|uniref:Toxin HicA n=1 Tax=Desulfosporosinus fructosivorans TaxID=2018669 RepID=A0A4Z0RCQ2_9FIRM|nr:toxin HicA [Desulfosporosinus fructosivorans]